MKRTVGIILCAAVFMSCLPLAASAGQSDDSGFRIAAMSAAGSQSNLDLFGKGRGKGYGPGDGTGTGTGPKDGTGYGPGTCTP